VDGQRRERLWRSVAKLVTDDGSSWAGGLCLVCVASLPSVDGASLTLRADSSAQELLAASDAWTAELEEIQYTLGEGPGVDAFTSGRPVMISDLIAEESRWPAFAHAATSSGTGAAFAFPLQLGGIRLGVLGLFRRGPGGLSQRELTDALLLAELAIVALLDRGEIDDLDGTGERNLLGGAGAGPHSLASSYQDVHIATGMLAAELRISLTDAFARLRAHAFAEERPLQAVARDVLDRRIRFDETGE
jgi:hypothetical protein